MYATKHITENYDEVSPRLQTRITETVNTMELIDTSIKGINKTNNNNIKMNLRHATHFMLIPFKNI